jgi:hypothetical protein
MLVHHVDRLGSVVDDDADVTTASRAREPVKKAPATFPRSLTLIRGTSST